MNLFREIRLRNGVNKKYKFRSMIEVIRKYEEFRMKRLEAEKEAKDSKDIDLKVQKYKNYMEAIGWVIHGQKTSP